MENRHKGTVAQKIHFGAEPKNYRRRRELIYEMEECLVQRSAEGVNANKLWTDRFTLNDFHC